jgi:hypothetical protein
MTEQRKSKRQQESSEQKLTRVTKQRTNESVHDPCKKSNKLKHRLLEKQSRREVKMPSEVMSKQFRRKKARRKGKSERAKVEFNSTFELRQRAIRVLYDVSLHNTVQHAVAKT